MSSLDHISVYSKILLKHGIQEEIAKVTSNTPDSLIGQHMASICEHVTISFKDKSVPQKSLFWKRKLVNPNPRTDAVMGRLIVKEGAFLTSVVDAMSSLCIQKLGTREDIKIQDLFPFVYDVDATNIWMENLKCKGYRMLDKMEQHGIDDAKLVLHNLAKLHGSSYALIQELGGKAAFLEKYPALKEPMFSPGAEAMIKIMFDPPFSGVLELLKESPDQASLKAFAKLQKFDGKFASTYVDVLRAPNLIDVINHGDCWNNNIMFLPGSNGRNKGLIFVDLQISRVTSPNADISFYIFSTCRQNVRKQCRELLSFYFDSLTEIVEKFGISLELDFEAFIGDFKEKAKLGFLYGILLNACKGAIKGHNTSKSEGKIEEDFTRLFNSWIKEDPDKPAEIVKCVVELLEDYESFGCVC